MLVGVVLLVEKLDSAVLEIGTFELQIVGPRRRGKRYLNAFRVTDSVGKPLITSGLSLTFNLDRALTDSTRSRLRSLTDPLESHREPISGLPDMDIRWVARSLTAQPGILFQSPRFLPMAPTSHPVDTMSPSYVRHHSYHVRR